MEFEHGYLFGHFAQARATLTPVAVWILRRRIHYVHMVFGLNAAARSAYASRGLGVMDLERPMLHRVDGHLDRLHYCLPGPPDFYTHALYNYVV